MRGTYNTGSKIKFKTSMLKSRLSYSGEKTTPLSKKYFGMMSSLFQPTPMQCKLENWSSGENRYGKANTKKKL